MWEYRDKKDRQNFLKKRYLTWTLNGEKETAHTDLGRIWSKLEHCEWGGQWQKMKSEREAEGEDTEPCRPWYRVWILFWLQWGIIEGLHEGEWHDLIYLLERSFWVLYEGWTIRDKSKNRATGQEPVLVFQVRNDKSVVITAEIVNSVGFGIYFGSRASKPCWWIWLGCEAKRGMEAIGLSNWGTMAITDLGGFGGRWVNSGRGRIKSLVLAMLNLRCQVDIQVEIWSWEMAIHLNFQSRTIWSWRRRVSLQIICSI